MVWWPIAFLLKLMVIFVTTITSNKTKIACGMCWCFLSAGLNWSIFLHISVQCNLGKQEFTVTSIVIMVEVHEVNAVFQPLNYWSIMLLRMFGAQTYTHRGQVGRYCRRGRTSRDRGWECSQLYLWCSYSSSIRTCTYMVGSGNWLRTGRSQLSWNQLGRSSDYFQRLFHMFNLYLWPSVWKAYLVASIGYSLCSSILMQVFIMSKGTWHHYLLH